MGRSTQSLPEWARRTNPIVRYHLRGGYHVDTIDTKQALRLFWLQAGLLVLSIPVPLLYNVGLAPEASLLVIILTSMATYTHMIMSAFTLPVAFGLYVYVLTGIGREAVQHIYADRHRQTLDLLRTTPPSLRDILLSKTAAAIWKYTEYLRNVVTVATLFSMPAIAILYEGLYTPQIPPYLQRLAVIVALASALLRLALEPIMVGALGTLVGSVVTFRTAGTIIVTVLTIAYLALINLPRLAPLSFPVRVVVEIGIPVILPLLIAWIALRFSIYLLTRD